MAGRACEHVFVTSQGSAHGRFTRAIQQGNLWAAEVAARELRGLGLDDALDLVGLIARSRPDRLERAAIRWHGRLEVEAQTLTITEAQFAFAALARLPSDPQAHAMLKKLLRQANPTLLRRMS
jgi:hypothetical protein